MFARRSITHGIYKRSEKHAAAAPYYPVWEHLEGKNIYIFNTGTSIGWRIGLFQSLSTGSYYYKSKIIFMPRPSAWTNFFLSGQRNISQAKKYIFACKMDGK